MCESLTQYSNQWIKERFIIRQFSPKEGSIQVQIRHPFQTKHMQVLRNVFVSMKSK